MSTLSEKKCMISTPTLRSRITFNPTWFHLIHWNTTNSVQTFLTIIAVTFHDVFTSFLFPNFIDLQCYVFIPLQRSIPVRVLDIAVVFDLKQPTDQRHGFWIGISQTRSASPSATFVELS